MKIQFERSSRTLGLRRAIALLAILGLAATHDVGSSPFAAASSRSRVSKTRSEAPSVPRAIRPDFTGTWKLDLARSELGKFPGQPKARTDVIEHRDPQLRQTLHLEHATRRDTTVYRYTTDSTRAVNAVDGRDIEARVWWEGATLRLDSKTRMAMFEMWLKERWTLSADGKTLTMMRRVKYPMGEGDQRLVFEKH